MAELPPYRQEAAALLAQLQSNPQTGLSSDEAHRRLEQYGPNQLQSAAAVPWWRRFLAQFEDLLVIILLIATVISFLEWFLQSPREAALPYEGLVILAIVLLNATLGFVQESRAEESVRALMELAAPESSVIRDGQRRRVPSAELVPGDLLLLEAGDHVPADARLLEAINLRSDEAALTGESVPVSKETAIIEQEAGLGDRQNMVFSGTTISYGRGRALVAATGMQTEVGRIAGLIESARKEQTPLQQELDRTGRRLSIIMLVIVAVVFATSVFVQGINDLSGFLTLFLFAVALAVAAIPEALPAIVTVGLSIGVRRMAASNAIVRKLPAVETLGSATVICTDKTGTLTRNEMTVRKIFTAGASVDVGGSGYIPEGEFQLDGRPLREADPALIEEIEKTLRAAVLANDADLLQQDERWVVQGDPTEGALIVAAHKYGLPEAAIERRFPRVGEIPFTSERKRHTTLHADAEHPELVRVFVKGAPDVVLSACTFIREGEQVVELNDTRCNEVLRQNEALASQALRTLAVAFRSINVQDLGLPQITPHTPDGQAPGFSEADLIRLRGAVQERKLGEQDLEQELVFLGIMGMIDPPRPEAREAVSVARRAHIRTVMITGDHQATAIAIARELGIMEDGKLALTGQDLRAMNEGDLDTVVEDVRVFARVDPEHKLRIVEALQRKGHVVAMTGDGINDAPALKTANIGVAMGITGTDVSKEAADMVLTDDNFASIVRAVEEGRGIFDNIRKYLNYLLSSNAGELLTMFMGVMLASLLGLISPEEGATFFLPLLASQLLWINLITDGPPALALGIDPKDPHVMQREPRRQGTGVISNWDWLRIAGLGTIMMFGTLAVLDAYYPGGLFTWFARETQPNEFDEQYARTMAFTTLMMFQMFNVFNSRAIGRSAFSGLFENRWLLGAVALSVLFQILVVYLPALQTAFRTSPLNLRDWGIAVGIASILLIIAELARLIQHFQRSSGQQKV